MTAEEAFPPGAMRWLIGIEDTCVVPEPGGSMGPLDEYDLTDHTGRWREDLERVRDLGADGLRYGVQWPKVHLAPGVFDWSVLDERLRFAAEDLGLTVIADLVHYGAPTWLRDSFADPGYPVAIAEFAGAFAARYRGLVDHVTPLNEPVTTASFCGLRGVWPPALTGWRGWTEVVLGMVEGMRGTIAAVRAANPDAVVVHVEASAWYRASTPELEAHAALLGDLAALPTDLLTGRVDERDARLDWLVEHGADRERVLAFSRDVPELDLIGVNYYPDLTPRLLVELDGEVEQRTVDRWTSGLKGCVRWFAERYGRPVLVTETSIEGDDERRSRWALESAAALGELRDGGLDVRGYTWWPLTDFVDWSWASGGRNVEEFQLSDASAAAEQRFGDVGDGRAAFLRRMGLLALRPGPDGSLERVPTAAADAFLRATGRVLQTEAPGAD